MLPIRPIYVGKIFSGEKRYEFRKRVPRKPADHILIYETAPVSKVVGIVKVSGILAGSPSAVWEWTKESAGISYEDYCRYFKDARLAYAFVLHDPQKFAVYRTPADYGCRGVPQGMVYVENMSEE